MATSQLSSPFTYVFTSQEELVTYRPPLDSAVADMDAAGRRGTRTNATNSDAPVYCHGVCRTTLGGGRVGYGHCGDTLGFRCRLLSVPLAQVDGDQSRGPGPVAVVAAMSNAGTMHTGLSPAPFDLWFEHVLLPIVQDMVEDRAESVIHTFHESP